MRIDLEGSGLHRVVPETLIGGGSHPRSQRTARKMFESRGVLFMTFKAKSLIVLILMATVDAVIPLPIIGAVLIYVVLQKPPWFSRIVREIYLETSSYL